MSGYKSKLGAAAAATALMFSSAASAAPPSPVNARAGEYRAAATSDAQADELFRGRRAGGGRLLFLLGGISIILITIFIVVRKDKNASPGASN